MNRAKAPIIVLITFLWLLPMSAYLTVQFALSTLGQPLVLIGGESWDMAEWALRILPWGMILFAYPFSHWTEGDKYRRSFSTFLLVSMNFAMYEVAFHGFAFLTPLGEGLTIMFIALVDFWAAVVYLFGK